MLDDDCDDHIWWLVRKKWILFFISRERSSISQTRMVEWVSWSGWEKMYPVWLVTVRAFPGVEAMLVSSNIRVGQKRIEGLCELKTLQNLPSAIICLLPFLSDTIDSLDTPDAPARKGFLFSSLLIIWSVKELNNDHCCRCYSFTVCFWKMFHLVQILS